MKVLAWPARRNAARNPYNKLLYDAVEAQEDGAIEVIEFSPLRPFGLPKADILHMHWPDVFLAGGAGWRFWPRLIYLKVMLRVARMRGMRVIWTAHNLQRASQRHAARMARHFWPSLPARLDGVIYMTQASVTQAAESFPALAARPFAVIPHGDYRPTQGALAEAPIKGLPTALFFGSITRYKNAATLLEAFLEMPAGQARLEIRGKMSLRDPDTALTERLAVLPPERAEEVTYENRFLPEDALLGHLRAADLVVLPYTDVLNSGAALFALSAGRPILASDTRLFRELQDSVGADWVRLIKGPLSGAELSAALTAARALRQSGATPDLSAFDWDRIGAQTVAFYRQVMR